MRADAQLSWRLVRRVAVLAVGVSVAVVLLGSVAGPDGWRPWSTGGHSRSAVIDGAGIGDGEPAMTLPAGAWHVWVWRTNQTFRYAHMTMLQPMPHGRIAAAWQAAPQHEGQALAELGVVQAIHFSLSRDEGRSWTVPRVAVKGMSPVWGPVLHFEQERSRLWLFYSVSTEEDSPGGDIVYRTTADLDSGAPSWSPPTVLWRSQDGLGWPKVTANRLAVLASGEFVLPVWQEAAADHRGVSSVLVGRQDPSAPDSRVWNVKGHLESTEAGWLIEGTVAELSMPTGRPSMLHLFRTRDKHIWRSLSQDAGSSWTPPERVESLANPNSKVSLTRVTGPGGKTGLVLAYNPSSTAVRSPLVLAYSADGFTWLDFAVLEDEARVPGQWYAYPTVVQHGPMLYTSYTVYDHPPVEGHGVGSMVAEARVYDCLYGRKFCSPASAAAETELPAPVRKTKMLKNRFLGVKLVAVPLPGHLMR